MVNESLPGKKNGHEVNTRFLTRDLQYKIYYPKRVVAKTRIKTDEGKCYFSITGQRYS